MRETAAKMRGRSGAQQWDTYVRLGWLEAPPLELALILEELGYATGLTPFLATATWFAPVAGRLPEGSGTAVFDGTGRYVLDVDRAGEVAMLTHRGITVVPGDRSCPRRPSRLRVPHRKCCRPWPARGLPRPADHGRLPVRAHHHHPFGLYDLCVVEDADVEQVLTGPDGVLA
ncbi:hypothetical protein AB0K68_24620 [Streptomyces sp. NPDC050698]